MTYFRELPNLEYENFLSDSPGASDYVLMKNIFIRGKLRDDLQNVFTVFNKYIIQEDERPDEIADKLYGDPGLDWVIRVVAEIINIPNDYPLSSQELWNFCVDKYGIEQINDVRNYQTVEVKNNRGQLILPGGLVVDREFAIPDPDNPGGVLNPTTGVSNFDYERERNDNKREIFVLKKGYLGQFLNDMRDISTYGFNSEFVDIKTIRVTNSKVTSP